MHRNSSSAIVAWLGFLVYVAAGVMVRRRGTGIAPIIWLNLACAACILGYWVLRWTVMIQKGMTWYVTDQILPICAILVCLLAVLSLTGRYTGTVAHWLVYGLDGILLLAVALFATFFRINRLM